MLVCEVASVKLFSAVIVVKQHYIEIMDPRLIFPGRFRSRSDLNIMTLWCVESNIKGYGRAHRQSLGLIRPQFFPRAGERNQKAENGRYA